ncbi:MAG TPA: DUF1887 family protein [Thioploca sp.]|nr:MAG: hypothetical protein B6247_19455 [Beggiatoa sp. 4572_84]RKZ60390.1 MAG: DUF1887 domain-containing protein [Gammaproteobacteria bacterium]HDN25736.1 DUF1887 family protein [Thioploca sp.]
MLKPAIHLCLVHNTATANVTPALDPNFRPNEVILLYSPDKEYRTSCFESVLKPTGVKVTRWPIQDARDVEHIRDRVLELMIERENEDIALNASGGTRPMSIAAYEVFKEFNKPIFYVHPETDDVSWINRRELPSFNVADRIKLPAFLHAHGAEVSRLGERRGVPSNLRRLTQELVNHAESLAKPLAAINWLAQQAENNLKSPTLTERQRHWPQLNELIQQFAAEGLLTDQDDSLHFKDEASRFFVNGGWLEDYTYSLIYGLRREIPEIQDVGRSVELCRDCTGRAVKNELDVAFLHNNHLYIIECKTKRFIDPKHTQAPPSDFDTHAADALYKLDTLKWLLGGVHTKVMLVSYHPLSPWDRQRAQDLRIKTCTAQQLVGLKKALRRWIG